MDYTLIRILIPEQDYILTRTLTSVQVNITFLLELLSKGKDHILINTLTPEQG